MKIAIVLCTLFALTLAVRPVPYNYRERSRDDKSSRIIYPTGFQSRDSNRIINGNNDKKGAHPYQISLQRLGSSWFHTCGGSIISSTRILTAAHCVDDTSVSTSSYRVIAGEHVLYSNEGTEQTIGITAKIIHPKWDAAKINNDVAVLPLAGALKLGQYVATVSLATKKPAHGTASTVTGWGRTQFEPAVRPTILQVLKTETFVETSSWWGTEDPGDFTSLWDPNTQVATRDPNEGVCMGDSGGPLVVGDKGEQYGIVSYGQTPCGQDRPDYFANVAYFRSWILAQ